MITLFDDFDFGKIEISEETAKKICEAALIAYSNNMIDLSNEKASTLTEEGLDRIADGLDKILLYVVNNYAIASFHKDKEAAN